MSPVLRKAVQRKPLGFRSSCRSYQLHPCPAAAALPLLLARIPETQTPEQAHLGVFPHPCPECPSLCHLSALGAVTRPSRVPAQSSLASELPSHQGSSWLWLLGARRAGQTLARTALGGASAGERAQGHDLPHALLTSNLRACGGHALAKTTKSSAKTTKTSAKSCLKRAIMEKATSRSAQHQRRQGPPGRHTPPPKISPAWARRPVCHQALPYVFLSSWLQRKT